MLIGTNEEERIFKNEQTKFWKLNQLVSDDLEYKEELKRLFQEFLFNFRSQFQIAIEQKDKNTLRNLFHKSKPSWKLLEVENIEDEFSFVLDMLNQPIIPNQRLTQSVEKINSICQFFSGELIKW